MPEQTRYFTFPVHLLRGAFSEIEKVAGNIMHYAGYAHTRKLDKGNQMQKMKAAGDFLGVTWGDQNRAFLNGESLYKQSPKNPPMTSISKDILFDYYNNRKSEYDIACLLAFVGIRSILQTKPYCKTNKRFIHARMFGYRSIVDMPDSLSEIEEKYLKRWHIDKVLKELQHHWGLKLLSDHSRGFYLSFTVNYDDLAVVLVESKKKTKDIKLSKTKSKAIEKARQHINNI